MLGFVRLGVVFKTIAGGQVNATATGLEDFRKIAEQSRLLFSSLRQQITGFESAGDTVTVHIDNEGVLAGDLPKGIKAGDTLKRKGRSVFEFLDGQLYRLTDCS
jgi:hypothetical protein